VIRDTSAYLIPKNVRLGDSYFILFIDDFTIMNWMCFFKEKSEAINKFKAFKTLVENERETKIKCLRSDNGGEFTSKLFDVFYETHGIKRQFSEHLNKMGLLKERT
jgi:hypothetical protein